MGGLNMFVIWKESEVMTHVSFLLESFLLISFENEQGFLYILDYSKLKTFHPKWIQNNFVYPIITYIFNMYSYVSIIYKPVFLVNRKRNF